MTGAENSNTQVRDALRQHIQDMIYLSESEAGLELLPPDPVLNSQAAVAAAICSEYESQVSDAATFLRTIRDSVAPHDTGLARYLQQWEDLFAFLSNRSEDVCVYQYGNDPRIIDIAAIVGEEAMILRTSAVET